MIQSKDILMPHHLPNLAAWFRFNRGITVTGAGVSQWDDVSGNVRHLVQGTDAARPPKQSDGSILFDGAAQFLATAGFALAQPFTMYMLFRQLAWISADRILDGVGVANTPSLRQTTAGASPQISVNAGADLTIGTATLNQYVALQAVLNGASSVLQTNRDTAAEGNGGASAMTGITLGCSAAASGFANIQVKEYVLFGAAHDAVTRSRVVNYLRSVVGVA